MRCPAVPASTACSTPRARFSTSARRAISRAGSASYFQPSNVQPKVQALVRQDARTWRSRSPTPTPRRCCSSSTSSRSTVRASTSCCATTRVFPTCTLETEHEFPRLNFYRGSRKEPGRFFGPYPSAGAVRETLQQLQKLFRMRNCEDTLFRQPLATLPAVPDPTLHGALRRADFDGAAMRAMWMPRSRSSKGAMTKSAAISRGAWKRAAERLDFEEAARAARPAGASQERSRRSRSSRRHAITMPT